MNDNSLIYLVFLNPKCSLEDPMLIGAFKDRSKLIDYANNIIKNFDYLVEKDDKAEIENQLNNKYPYSINKNYEEFVNDDPIGITVTDILIEVRSLKRTFENQSIITFFLSRLTKEQCFYVKNVYNGYDIYFGEKATDCEKELLNYLYNLELNIR